MNDDSIALADELFAPITSAIGFLNLGLHDAAAVLGGWRRELYGRATTDVFDGGLVDNVTRLDPLTMGNRPRELLVQTSNPEWTAYFDCLYGGTDPYSSVAVMSRRAGVRGLAVTARPMITTNDARPWGSRKLEVFGPGGSGPRSSIRHIALVQDGSRWHFDLSGEPLPCEDLDAYKRRRVLDRFTGSMLESYARALGLDAFALEFYRGPSILVTSAAPVRPGDAISLADRRKQLGYED